ncbi:MAG: hypothetical protein WEA36_10580 [Balneolaceae bacterium]
MRDWIRWLIILPLVFIAMLAGFWFAYPWLNPDVVNPSLENGNHVGDTVTEETILISDEGDLEEFAGSTRTFSRQEQIERELHFIAQIDSLEEENRLLKEDVRRLESNLAPDSSGSTPVVAEAGPTEEAGEAFAQRIKSLLNLDEREMGPILDRLNQDQLIRIYKEAGNMQREKILRSLSTDRSAQLITEVM